MVMHRFVWERWQPFLAVLSRPKFAVPIALLVLPAYLRLGNSCLVLTHHSARHLIAGGFQAADAELGKHNLRRAIVQEFKRHKDAPQSQQAQLLDTSLAALRALIQQQNLAKCSSSATTDDIEIEVTSSFDQAGQRGPDRVYVYSYRVRITNRRQEIIKVLGREWHIREGNGQLREIVKLDPTNAVVGQQPGIPPGDCFEYTSGTPTSSAEATMYGKFLVEIGKPDKDGNNPRYALAEVPEFKLQAPKTLPKHVDES